MVDGRVRKARGWYVSRLFVLERKIIHLGLKFELTPHSRVRVSHSIGSFLHISFCRGRGIKASSCMHSWQADPTFKMKLTLLWTLLPCLVVGFAPSASQKADRTVTQLHQSTDHARWTSSEASWAAALTFTFAAGPALAVSGGGLDYANLDITGSTEFANGNFKGKDFTQGTIIICTDDNENVVGYLV